MDSARDLPKGRGFPIRTSADQRSLASPRGFSQRATSFIASRRQGIHRTPLSRSGPTAAAATACRTQGRAAAPKGRTGFVPAWKGRGVAAAPGRRARACVHLNATQTPNAHMHSHTQRARAVMRARPRLRTNTTDPDSPVKERAAACPRPAKGRPGEAAVVSEGPRSAHRPAGVGRRAGRPGGDRIRTDDPLLAKQVLSRLSYAPAARHRSTDRAVAGRHGPGRT